MQYDSIILELMSRIKKLEEEIQELKVRLDSVESTSNAPVPSTLDSSTLASSATSTYTKTTDQMISLCYHYGKNAYLNRSTNLGELADRVSAESGMNRNSAFMYICAVKALLEGTVFKRAINAKSIRQYLNSIYQEFGRDGLQKALSSLRLHIEYRIANNIPSESIDEICKEFEKKL